MPQKNTLPKHQTQPKSGRLRAAWTLVLLTTLCAELTFTAVAVPITWLLLPLLMIMYGAGVLVVRELVVRAGGGWPSLVLMGLAYQLAEDGLGLQALTSSEMYGAADWGWRALGVNWTYWGSQIGVHVVFSVLIPVMLTGILFPAHRDRPYLRTGGLVGTGVLAVLGVVGLRVVVAGTEDPGYQITWGWFAGFIVAIVALAVFALMVLPRRGVPGLRSATLSPKPAIVGVVAGLATMVFLVLLLPPGLAPGSAPMLNDLGVPLPVLLATAAVVGVGSGWLVQRWSTASDWSDQHRIWLAGGILVAHTAFMMPASMISVVIGAVVVVLEVVLLMLLARRVARRAKVVSAEE